MNRLELLALDYSISPTVVLSYGQDYGIISDNAFHLRDVANADQVWLFIVRHWKEFRQWKS